MPDQRTKKPPCTEEQATRWLAWLARGMQTHGQTVFLIEQLQPSWLPTRIERCAYLLTSRLLAGFLFVAPWIYVAARLGADVFLLVSFASIFILAFALIDVLRLESSLFWRGTIQVPARWQAALSVLLVFLPVAMIAEWSRGQSMGLSYSLIGLTWGPVWASRGAGRDLANDVQTAETTRWSWPGALKKGLLVLGIEALLLVMAGLLQLASPQELSKEGTELTFPVILIIAAPFAVLLGLLVGGLKHSVLEMRTSPNQGVRLSIRTAAWSGGLGLLVFGSILWLMALAWGDQTPLERTSGALKFGSVFAMFIALSRGGLDVLQHGILRLLLASRGHLPLRLPAFLDYAAVELRFLQKVGGGYMFIHRSLLEYFAA